MIFGSKILDRINEEKDNVSITLDKSVIKRLEELKQKKKLKKISPLINELIKQWLEELKKEEEEAES